MREILLWIIGRERTWGGDLYQGLKSGCLVGKPEDYMSLLNYIVSAPKIEDVENLALNSAGLRTVRALYMATQSLKHINANEFDAVIELCKLEYPYQYLVKKGEELDMAFEEGYVKQDEVLEDVEEIDEEEENEEDNEEEEAKIEDDEDEESDEDSELEEEDDEDEDSDE